MRKALTLAAVGIASLSLCGCSGNKGVVDIKYNGAFDTRASSYASPSVEYKEKEEIEAPLYNNLDEIETNWQLRPYDFNESIEPNSHLDRYRGIDRELLDENKVLINERDFTIIVDEINYAGSIANINYTIMNSCPLDIKLRVNLIVNGVSTGLREYEVESLGYTRANAFMNEDYMNWSKNISVKEIRLGEIYVEYVPDIEYPDADKYVMLRNAGYQAGEPEESVEISEGMEKMYSDSTCDIWYSTQPEGDREKGIWVLIQNKSQKHGVSLGVVDFGEYDTIDKRLEANTDSITYGFISLRGEQYEMLDKLEGEVEATFKLYYTNNPEIGEVRFNQVINFDDTMVKGR